jgi:sugar lactone lactonase YvrE
MASKTLCVLLAFAAALAIAPAAGARPFPDTIELPAEWRPEGIATGKGTTFYVSSIPQGAVWRGDYRTGRGSVLVPPHPGRNHIGLKFDHGRLFVAGGPSKGIYVYDARTGEDVRAYSVPEAGFINDVVVTRDGAWFTDSQVQQLYFVPIGRHGELGELRRVPITGDLEYTEGFNANGITATPNGKRLIIVKSNTGQLFVSDLAGRTREIELDVPVPNGDGILLRGHTLYVVQNQLNRIAVVDLDGLRSGEVERYLTDPRFDIPTTIAPFGGALYAVNARFNRPDTSPDDIIRVKP